jgi:hypothetical protein
VAKFAANISERQWVVRDQCLRLVRQLSEASMVDREQLQVLELTSYFALMLTQPATNDPTKIPELPNLN